MAAVTSTTAPGATPAPEAEKITWTRADGSEVPGLAYGTSEPAATSTAWIPPPASCPRHDSQACAPPDLGPAAVRGPLAEGNPGAIWIQEW